MKILSLETSTKNFSLAVSDGDKILAYRNVRLNKVLSSSIIPGIKGILKKSSLSLKDLDGFAVGLGPGSFTSLRVGLSTVKALALASGKPVVGISSLDVLAMNIPDNIQRQICAACDAKRHLVYSCFYHQDNGQVRKNSEYLLVPLDELLKKIKEPTVLIGDAISCYREKITAFNSSTKEKIKAQRVLVWEREKDWYPQARVLARLAAVRFRKNAFDNVDALVPLYLYPQDCQVQR